MTKILAISDVHGEENPKLYDYLENNDIDRRRFTWILPILIRRGMQ